MLLYSKGDRIICVLDHPDDKEEIVAGMTGTVVSDCKDTRDAWVHIKWDEFVDGHSESGECEYGYGWSCPKQYVEPLVEAPEYEDVEFGEDILSVIANG